MTREFLALLREVAKDGDREARFEGGVAARAELVGVVRTVDVEFSVTGKGMEMNLSGCMWRLITDGSENDLELLRIDGQDIAAFLIAPGGRPGGG